jgi:phytoene desaturase
MVGGSHGKGPGMTKVVIIGAGVGGMATANLLARAGYTVEVYEQAAGPGGRVGLLLKDGFTFDTGPSWFLMKDVFEHYYKLLGSTLAQELELVRLDPAYKVYYENKAPVTITSDPARDEQTFEGIEPGAGAKLRNYVARSREIYDLAVAHFLYTNFNSPKAIATPVILKNSLALLHFISKSLDSHVRSTFSDPRLQQILEYHAVFLGVSPYKAPAIYSLMSALDFSEGVYYPQGGMYKLIDSLASHGQTLGVTYHYNAPVERIVSHKGKATGIVLTSTKLIEADIVISNADLHFTETSLLNPGDQSYPARYWQRKTASPSALLVYMGISGSIPEFEHHTLLFVDNWKDNFDAMTRGKMPDKASLYISKTSATDPSVAPAGSENIFVLIPIPAGVSLEPEEQQHYAEHYLEQVKQVTGVDLVSRASQMTILAPIILTSAFTVGSPACSARLIYLRRAPCCGRPTAAGNYPIYITSELAPGRVSACRCV